MTTWNGTIMIAAFAAALISSTSFASLIKISTANAGSWAITGAGAFDGFWFVDFIFFLPADATNIRLDFDHFTGDDHVVLMLNPTESGNEAVNGRGLGLVNLGAGDGLYNFSAGACGS